MKQTAVEWLIEQLENHNGITKKAFENVIKQAKLMEKEQIFKVYFHGFSNGIQREFISSEEYYKENFKSE